MVGKTHAFQPLLQKSTEARLDNLPSISGIIALPDSVLCVEVRGARRLRVVDVRLPEEWRYELLSVESPRYRKRRLKEAQAPVRPE